MMERNHISAVMNAQYTMFILKIEYTANVWSIVSMHMIRTEFNGSSSYNENASHETSKLLLKEAAELLDL